MYHRASPVEIPRPASVQRIRDLPAFAATDDRGATLPSFDEISRPSSTSTQASLALPPNHTLPTLPGLSALASVATGPSPHYRYVIDRHRDYLWVQGELGIFANFACPDAAMQAKRDWSGLASSVGWRSAI